MFHKNNLKKIVQILLTFIVLMTSLSTPLILTVAQETNNDNIDSILGSARSGAGYQEANLLTIPNMIGQIVAVVLGFVGSMFLILTIYSGLQWMTAGGNEDKVKAARTRMLNSVMGLAITIAAYFITYLISATLLGT